MPSITSKRKKYDVIIIGGAIMGSATSYFLSKNSDFNGKVLVVDKDLSFEFSSTARTNSCIRQQFSESINVKISQFAASFFSDLNKDLVESELPEKIRIDNFGYLYLASTQKAAEILSANQLMQISRNYNESQKQQIINKMGGLRAYPKLYNHIISLYNK